MDRRRASTSCGRLPELLATRRLPLLALPARSHHAPAVRPRARPAQSARRAGDRVAAAARACHRLSRSPRGGGRVRRSGPGARVASRLHVSRSGGCARIALDARVRDRRRGNRCRPRRAHAAAPQFLRDVLRVRARAQRTGKPPLTNWLLRLPQYDRRKARRFAADLRRSLERAAGRRSGSDRARGQPRDADDEPDARPPVLAAVSDGESRQFFFSPDEWKRFFPAAVIDHLKAARVDARRRSHHRGRRRRSVRCRRWKICRSSSPRA